MILWRDNRTRLFIDLETYSSADLPKTGVYKYVESNDFEITLLAFAYDDDEVEVLDTYGNGWHGMHAHSDRDAKYLNFVIRSLTDPDIVKVAHNAAFERVCLSRALGVDLPPEQWEDTAILSAMNGLPMSLEGSGAALQLDLQKMKEGAALIRYFCKPCKPTISNGGRTRNLPEHAPDKWATFREYCGRDVETEREIYKRLHRFPVPDWERRVQYLDARINERGVLIDTELAASAIAVDEAVREANDAEMRRLTGLDNPNSVAQLKDWLAAVGITVDSLNKATVSELLQTTKDPTIRRVLQLRQLMGKTSTKKYDAMLAGACKDHRVRGLLQYQGAGRTGRWCLTGDHEVLTPAGWVRLDEWPGGLIACWNHTTERISFQKSEAVNFYHSGDMVVYETTRCQQIATPEHKMPTLTRSGDWQPRTVREIGAHRVTIPFTGEAFYRRSANPDELRVLIMTQADGYYTADGAVRYHFTKLRKVERCKKLLRRCGIPFTVREYKRSDVVVKIPTSHVPLWLRQFRDKTFGYWLLDESPEVIFDELAEWDGYRCGPNSIQYSTTNEANADIIQACAVLGGYTATKLTKNRNSDGWSPAHLVNIWLKPGRGTSIRAEQIRAVDYEGKVYCATTPTGYFLVRRNGRVWVTGNSGRLLQVQNLPQNHLDDIADVRELVRARDVETLGMTFDSVPDVLSQLIRTGLVAKPGHTFLVADYSAIEARVVAYLAGERWRMDVFAGDGKIYEASYAMAFGVPVETVKKGSPERQKGKIMELALGYGGGVAALKAFGADKMGLTEDEMQQLVDSWRAASPTIPRFWRDAERAAKNAIEHPGRTFTLPCGAKYLRDADALRCRLPSGRVLSYWGAHIADHKGRPSVIFWGQNQTTRKWEKVETWGGKLVENIVQAYARDCLAVALLRLDAAGFKVVFHVHDEIIAEEPTDGRGWQAMADIMGEPIDWAPGLLLRGDGYETPFYMKD